jgi:hypothetical protein
VCKINASWNQIPGANRYTASVTRADGSVVDFGAVGAGSASFWVPYVGNGTYTVSVSAYGTPPGADEPEVVARDSSAAGSGDDTDSGAPPESPGPDATGGATTGEEPVEPAPTEPEVPTCEEPPVPSPEVPPDGEPTEAPADADPISDDAAAKLDSSAVLPEAVECPDVPVEPGPATG